MYKPVEKSFDANSDILTQKAKVERKDRKNKRGRVRGGAIIIGSHLG